MKIEPCSHKQTLLYRQLTLAACNSRLAIASCFFFPFSVSVDRLMCHPSVAMVIVITSTCTSWLLLR